MGKNLAFLPENPKRDQNRQFTPLSETTSIPVSFIWESPPPPGLIQEYSTEPFCKITVLQGHHELAGNLSTGIEILLAVAVT